MSPCIIIPWE
ncbi:saccharopine dehydrogenase-like oxidoreductase, partial [Trichonephila inaurata madagascariensis]